MGADRAIPPPSFHIPDAAMYKRESLERMLALSPDEETPDLALVCAGCKTPVTRRKNEAQKSRKHVHGKVLQVDPGFDRARVQRSKLKHDEAFSNFAFNFNLLPYTTPSATATRCSPSGCSAMRRWMLMMQTGGRTKGRRTGGRRGGADS